MNISTPQGTFGLIVDTRKRVRNKGGASPAVPGIIYAFRYKQDRVANKDGLLKVGNTKLYAGETLKGAAWRRIKDYVGTAGLLNDIEVAGVWEVPVGWDKTRFEKSVHRKLEEERGAHRVRGNGGDEWFLCSVDDVADCVAAVKSGKTLTKMNAYEMRDEQVRFVEATKNVFVQHEGNNTDAVSEVVPPRVLWNAKPRFGKTHTTYRVVKEMGFKRVLVVSRFPASVNEWRDNLVGHEAFSSWNFFTRLNTSMSPIQAEQNISVLLGDPETFVCFVSLQDITGKGALLKEHTKLVCDTNWDLVVFDEYHLGGQTLLNETFMGDTTSQFDEDTDEQERVFSSLRSAQRFLMLSGTPFRALETEAFDADCVMSWSYYDEQNAKATWDPGRGANPYAQLPQLNICTFDLPQEVIAEATSGTHDEFSLNQFFKCSGGKFVYETHVNKWLDVISASGLGVTLNYLDGGNCNVQSMFDDPELSRATQHSMWLFKSVDACNNMKELLDKHSFFKDFKVGVFAGDTGGNAASVAQEAKSFLAVNEAWGHRSIILTCGKLTAAVTLPQLGSVFMLTDTRSPELYFQAAFRCQSPYVDDNGTVLKDKCFVFDFTQNRTMELLSDYAALLRTDHGKNIGEVNRHEALEELIRFMPVYTLGIAGMKALDASDVMSSLLAGESPESLRRKMSSKNGITNNIDVLVRIASDPVIMEWLGKLERRCNGNSRRNGKKTVRVHASNIIRNSEALKDHLAKEERTARDERRIKDNKAALKTRCEELREVLTGVTEQIAAFLYVSDHPEMQFEEAVLAEEELFHKFVGVPQNIVLELVEMGAFNTVFMDRLVYKFMLLEDQSLSLLLPQVADRRRSEYNMSIPADNTDGGNTTTILETLEGNRDGQVFTPRKVANQMLDQYPESFWSDPTNKVIDVACKSGIFLLDAVNRFDEGLANAPGFEDRDVRMRHILTKQIFGIAATYKGALVTRRTLYGSKVANHPTLSCGYFDNEEGNIAFPEAKHNMKKGKCAVCRMTSNNMSFSDRHRESHAYPFIHIEDPQNIFIDNGEPVHFNAIVGNPPYTIEDDGNGPGSSPIYQMFVEQAKKLDPDYLSLVIQARWFSGGKKKLDKFRATMIADRRISKITYYPKAEDCFPDAGIQPKGGVMIFLRDTNHNGNCEWKEIRDGQITEQNTVDLRATGPTIVSDQTGRSILAAVRKKHAGEWMNSKVLPTKPFGLRTFVTGEAENFTGSIKLYQNGGIGFIDPASISKNVELVNKWKVIIPAASVDGMNKIPNAVIATPFLAEKGSACTETYLVAGSFDTQKEAEFHLAYMKTKFFRYMVSLQKNTQHNSRKVFIRVPVINTTVLTTDEAIYKHFNLSDTQIAHIENTILPM